MKREITQELFKECQDALHQHHLFDAITILYSLAKETTNSSFLISIESIENDYNAMLDFIANGGKDEASEIIQLRLLQKAFLLLNSIDASIRIIEANDYYTHCLEILANGTKQNENTFCHLATINNIETTDIVIINELIGNANRNELKEIISALGINLWNYFNPTLFKIVANLATKDIRASIVLYMTAMKHLKSISLFPDIQDLYTELSNKSEFRNNISLINREFYICSQTSKAKEQLEKIILPAFKDLMTDKMLMNDISSEDGLNNIDSILNSSENNEEFRKKREKLNDSFDIVMKMQEEGLDINVDNFNVLKKSSFFNSLYNWLKPFDINDKDLQGIIYDKNGRTRPIINILMEDPHICDIDLYGTILLLNDKNKTGVENGKYIEKLIDGDGLGNSPFVSYNDYKNREINDERDCRSFIRALYRLFSRSRWSKSFDNVFNYSTNILDNEYLFNAIAKDNDSLKNIADLMQKYKDMNDAICYYIQIIQNSGSDIETLLSIARCYIQNKKNGLALNYLQQAEVLTEHTDAEIYWLMHKCYDKLGQFDNCLGILLELEKEEPENEKIIAETGLTLIKTGDYQGAVQRFYKLEIEDKMITPSRRAIAWCSFNLKKYDQAMKYYEKITSTPGLAVWQDYINSGHTAWCMGNTKLALDYYKQYVKHYLTDDPKIKDALEPFDKDKEKLKMHGISESDIDLMHEMILRFTIR